MRKIISILLSLVLMLGTSITAFAEDFTSQTKVYMNVESNFVIGMPTTLVFDGEPNEEGRYESEYSVAVKGKLFKNQELYIGPESDSFPVYSTDETKPYMQGHIEQEKINFNETDFEGKEEVSVEGKCWVKNLTAGSWYGNIPFNVWLRDKNEEVSIPENAKYIYVSPDGSDETGDGTEENPYASVWWANNKITDNSASNPYVIKVADGVYTDLEERYKEATTGYMGISTKKYVYYVGNVEHPENVTIEWDLNKGRTEENLKELKRDGSEIFHIWHGANTSIQGFTLIARNTLRTLHVEMTGSGAPQSKYSIENCILHYYANSSVSDIVGCGCTSGEVGLYKNCTFHNHNKSNGSCGLRMYSVHDNVKNKASNEPAKIIFENCDFVSDIAKDDFIYYPTVTKANSTKTSGLTHNVYFVNCEAHTGSGKETKVDVSFSSPFKAYTWVDTNRRRLIRYNEIDNIKFELGSFNYSGLTTSKNTMRTHVLLKRSSKYSITAPDGYIIERYQMSEDTRMTNTQKSHKKQNLVVSTTASSSTIFIGIQRADGKTLTQDEIDNMEVSIVQLF